MRYLKNPKFVLIGAISLLLAKSLLQIWGINATIGGYIVLITAPIVIYSLIVGVVALLVAAVRRNVRKYWLAAFAWLLLIAATVDLGSVAYTKLFTEPKINSILSQSHTAN